MAVVADFTADESGTPGTNLDKPRNTKHKHEPRTLDV